MPDVQVVTPDAGDDGVGSVIDTTKVTSSTPADQPLPQPRDEAVRRGLQPGSASPNRASGGTTSGEKSHIKDTKWAAQHTKATWSGGKLFGFAIELAGHHQVKPNKNRLLIDSFVEPEPVLGTCPFSFLSLRLICAT
ncbi:hypothetical protein P5G63_20950 [Aeromonas salmonicida]|uniref:hypothetical protein n=1 Tax=Aeromonas salmonicida TaxID=645 RepID=UPI0022406B73|nr:hypothetical protein [Aeromonas salmonicida]MDF8330820.1 hypothetical protein [Aeromonas salmonicida]